MNKSLKAHIGTIRAMTDDLARRMSSEVEEDRQDRPLQVMDDVELVGVIRDMSDTRNMALVKTDKGLVEVSLRALRRVKS